MGLSFACDSHLCLASEPFSLKRYTRGARKKASTLIFTLCPKVWVAIIGGRRLSAFCYVALSLCLSLSVAPSRVLTVPCLSFAFAVASRDPAGMLNCVLLLVNAASPAQLQPVITFEFQLLWGLEPQLGPNLAIEGIAFDSKHGRLVFGGVTNGRIFGVPVPTDLSSVSTYNSSDVYDYVAYGAVGSPKHAVGLENDPGNPCLIYSAVAIPPWNDHNASAPLRGAIATYDICNNTVISQLNLTPLLGALQLVDDQVKIGDHLYVADFLGNQSVWHA
jgi:hypothetical protein